MNQRERLCIVVLLLIGSLSFFTTVSFSQSQRSSPDPIQTPIDIQFTKQMSQSETDFEWSQTYYDSYMRTKEPPYLRLAAEFCLKAINRLANLQTQLSRTTKFYNWADKKRLQACQFYTKLQRQSFLLKTKNHLTGTVAACQ